MKVYQWQLKNNCKKLAVIILLSLILISAVEAGGQSACDACGSQTKISVTQTAESNDLAGSITSINRGKTQLSDKELFEEYHDSIEGKIIGTISDMMAIFIILALLCMLIIFIIK